jgi:hypothetical protein
MAVIAADMPGLLSDIFDAYANNRITDTMIREQLLDIADGTFRSKSYSLASVAKHRLGLDLDKSTVRLRYSEMLDIPCAHWPEAFKTYAIDDAVATYQIWQDQESRADLLVDQFRQARAAFWIQLMSVWGMRIDQDKIREILVKLHAGKAATESSLLESGLLRSNGTRDTKKAGARLVLAYARKGVDHPVTDTGKPALNREACQSSDDPELVAYAEFSKYPTMIAKVEKMDLPILHPHVKVLTWTGRTSSGADEDDDTGINSQNFSRDHGEREAIIPREGCKLVAADYTMLELFAWAQVCKTLLGQSAMAEALNRREDPHMIIASNILGKPLDWCVANKKTKEVFQARQTGKVVNFGCPGGLGAPTLVHYAKQSWNVSLTDQQAEDLRNLWFSMWPESREYFRVIGRVVETRGCVEQLFSGRLRSGVRFTNGCNTLFQGLGSDIAKAAGFDIARSCYIGSMSPARMILFVHDEFVLEAPTPMAEFIGSELRRLMIEAAKPWLPDVTTIDAEVRILDRYSK